MADGQNRTYAKRIAASHANMTAEQIRANKNARTKARNEARRAAKAEKIGPALTPENQIKALDFRLGVGVGAKRERARLAKLINTTE